MTTETTGTLSASQALRAAATRVADLLGAVRQPDAPVPGLGWTLGDTAAHLVAEFLDYTAFAGGKLDPGPDLAAGETAATRQATANAAQLARLTERDLSRLAAMVRPAAEDWLTTSAGLGRTDRVRVSNGLSMTASTMTAALLGELLVHGLDIARAAQLPWTIGRPDALHVIDGVMTLVPDYLDRRRAAGLHVSYELRFRGGPRYRIAVDDGVATVSGPASAPGPRADCWISADPVAFLLVGYGRANQWSQIARGKLLAGGRKPWLGTTFGQLITGP